MAENAIEQLENACERMRLAVEKCDWASARAIDEERARLVDGIAAGFRPEVDAATRLRLSNILRLDAEIQSRVTAARRKAREDLLSVEQSQSAIELYRRQ
ncbi:MAG TPA: hypothetical protein ENK26_06360 [Gammaproteobacteria bacterium]|nr:hypothetical protein [Gammaproteobacteria bacterium]